MTATQRLLDRIYASTYDVTAWDDILPAVARLTGALGATLQTPALPTADNPMRTLALYNFDAEVVARGLEEHGAADPFSQPMYDHLQGRWYRVVSALRHCDQDALPRNPFWTEHLARVDVGDTAGVSLHEQEDGNWPLVTVGRRRRDGPFEQAALARLQAFAPHLRLATRLRFDAADVGALDPAVASAFAPLSTGCLLLGARGRLLLANPAAERMLAGRRILNLQHSAISALTVEGDAALQQAVHQAVHDGPEPRLGAEVVLTGPESEPIAAVICPVGGDQLFTRDFGAVRAVVWLLEPRGEAESDRAARRLAQVFGLSLAEADVAAAIVAGQEPEEIAAARARSIHTVRAQIRSILGKAGVRRVGDLQALRGLATFAAPR